MAGILRRLLAASWGLEYVEELTSLCVEIALAPAYWRSALSTGDIDVSAEDPAARTRALMGIPHSALRRGWRRIRRYESHA